MLERPPRQPFHFSSSAFLRAVKELLSVQAALIPEGASATVLIAGGTAVQLWTLGNVTCDLDCEFSERFYPRDLTVAFTSEDGKESGVYLDRAYTSALAVMHEDYTEDAVFVTSIGALSVWVLHPVDLALSKVTRWQEHDRNDVRRLAEAGLVDPKVLAHRAEEALEGAIGNLPIVRINLGEALALVRRYAPEQQSHATEQEDTEEEEVEEDPDRNQNQDDANPDGKDESETEQDKHASGQDKPASDKSPQH